MTAPSAVSTASAAICCNERSWRLRLLVANTGGWLAGRQVLLARASARDVDWGFGLLRLFFDRTMIAAGPRFGPAQPIEGETAGEPRSHRACWLR